MHNSAMMRPSNEAAEPDWLQAAVSELSRRESEPTVFSNQLSGLVTNLMQAGVKVPAEALDPLFATLERHVAAPIAQINLGDFARLAQAANQLWMVSGRDMALERCEAWVQRLGRHFDACLHEIGDEPAQLIAEHRRLGFMTGKF